MVLPIHGAEDQVNLGGVPISEESALQRSQALSELRIWRQKLFRRLAILGV